MRAAEATMDHAEVREALELAAVEPGGLDAFLRGGSAQATSVNQHLAECAACGAHLSELREAADTIRDVIRTTPSPDLRARTLDLVAAADRARAARSGAEAPRRRFSLRSLIPAAALGAAAAAMIGGVVAWRALDARITAADGQIAQQRAAITGLGAVADWTLRVGAAPDAALIRLAPAANGGDGSGTVILSADRGELVMIASGLPAPPAGFEYRCWIDQGSGPERIGRMYRVGQIDYWGGAVERIRGIHGPFTLGVSLASQTGDAGGDAVLRGSQ
jgi:hypothetical protein